jgi:HD-GYP domain-containing protein (c-di-GMP phosphodiesterase class II)|tara:strand:- start:69 stop:611 length:543 start_codon:yes stop_codon:yes gene_type:complete
LRNLDEIIPILEAYLREVNLNFTALFGILEKDPPVYIHSANVGFLCAFLGIKAKMNLESVRELTLGGMLFDVGKKEVPYEILTKKGELTPEEFRAIRKHPAAGKKVLNDIKCYSKNILAMASEHHEKFDGTRYPFGLSENKITPFAKIYGIMDVFSSLTCDRDHREPFTPLQALTMMKKK